MKKLIIVLAIIAVLILLSYTYVKGIYNNIVEKDQGIKSAWGQVENVYQSRFDKIPQLVNVVKGYKNHEQSTLIAVTEARAKVGGVMKIDPKDIGDPEKLKAFQQAQNSLGGALQRLMVVQERYPELKANENFLRLQDEISATENSIKIERRRFNEEVKSYNVYIKKFPQVILANSMGYTEKAYFSAAEGSDKAPDTSFEDK